MDGPMLLDNSVHEHLKEIVDLGGQTKTNMRNNEQIANNSLHAPVCTEVRERSSFQRTENYNIVNC